ncbi:hypothetical protein QBE53_04500 [Vallitaleaceae bacterium 9-2]
MEYIKKIGNRKELYKVVAKTFNVTSALYPGSHVDISPSLVIPDVTYIDNYKGTISFFADIEPIYDYINQKKDYDEACHIRFYGENYEDNFDLGKVDLIISQYAGFVGQSTKKYLKDEGILLCNDSHGDATLAYLDDAFEFIGVVDANNRIATKQLDQYFQFARQRKIDIEKVKQTMKGPKYKHQAPNYLFRYKNLF